MAESCRFTVDDPLTYEQPWTASIPMSRIDGPLYEYACHEGNYGLENILRGARTAERAEAASKQACRRPLQHVRIGTVAPRRRVRR